MRGHQWRGPVAGSDASSFVTGSIVTIDGGFTAMMI